MTFKRDRSAYQREYYKKHKDLLRALAAHEYQQTIELNRMYARAYYAANKEKILARHKQWRDKNAMAI